jgi:hypothetical protein
MSSVLSFSDKYCKSWPKHPIADVTPGDVMGAAELFTRPFTTDRHFVGYLSELPCRLSSGVFEEQHAETLADLNLRMLWAVLDVDDPVTHGTGQPARPEWLEGELPKLEKLLDVHPGLFIYPTRGGYRPVGALPEPFLLRGRADAAKWTARYYSWCRYVQRRFGIAADKACADWTRPFRAPFVIRDGILQTPATYGNPASIGVWEADLKKDDRVTAKKTGEEYYGAVHEVPIADRESIYGQARINAARVYLCRAPLSIKGQGGRNTMFTVCAALVRRMRLPLDIAVDLLDTYYNPRLRAAGTSTWSRTAPSKHGMSLEERCLKAATTGNVPPGNVLDEATFMAEYNAPRRAGSAR